MANATGNSLLGINVMLTYPAEFLKFRGIYRSFVFCNFFVADYDIVNLLFNLFWCTTIWYVHAYLRTVAQTQIHLLLAFSFYTVLHTFPFPTQWFHNNNSIKGLLIIQLQWLLSLYQGHREFPFWKRKIPSPRQRKNSRSLKCLILHAVIQQALKLATFIWINYNDMVSLVRCTCYLKS